MQEKTNIQTSTLRVPKNILEEIKIYCRKAGKPVGEWVETAWKFIEKNDFDIYDKETTSRHREGKEPGRSLVYAYE